MKKTITLLFATFLAFGMSAQFSVGLDYMILQGTMIEDVDGNAVTYVPKDETDAVEVIPTSAVLNVSYTHPLSEKLDMVGSVGLGMMFTLVPMKLGISYGITSDISANLGMGMYMITDESYRPTVGDVPGTSEKEDWNGSINAPGMNFGLTYNMNAIGIGIGYDMIKSGEYTLDAITISLSYAFGGEKAEKEEVKK